MPRKTDGMLFELQPRPTSGEDGKPLLYARPAAPDKRTMKDVATYCSFKGINSALVEIAFSTFIDVCSEWLADGYRVETPLGIFSPKIKLEGDFTDPAKVQGKDVSFAGIELLPSKQFIKAVSKNQHGFRKKSTRVGNAHMRDEALMAEALRSAMKNGFTTIRQFIATSGLKYHSAQRYLEHLCYAEPAKLRRMRIGGAVHYFPKEQTGEGK